MLSYDFDEFVERMKRMWDYVFDLECFVSYLGTVCYWINNISMLILLLLPFVFLLPLLFKMLLLHTNEAEHAEKARSVEYFESVIIIRYKHIKSVLNSFWTCCVKHKSIIIVFVALWLVNLNILTILFEFLAYYLYMAFSFDLANLPIQFAKLLIDIIIMFSGAPFVFWCVVAYLLIRFIRKAIGYKRLKHRENLDRAFIDRQPLIMMFTGTMGTGKTTALTSVAISLEIKFREKALELMMDIDSKYPNFPWIKLEDDLKNAIQCGKIKNLTTCRDYISELEQAYENSKSEKDLFGYDILNYRYSFDDNLTHKNIWNVLSDYACLYFIYIIQSSLIVSNYSIRVDNKFDCIGNFPLWDFELFRNSPDKSMKRSRRSHVLDYDILRLGRTVLKDNPRRSSFEFGVVGLSEFAKERGNQLTLQEIKKNVDETNQKNDLFAYALKMCRHKATICGFPFVAFVCDEQRPESLGADTRDLLSIINIDKKNDKELLMPFYFVEELFHDIFFPIWLDFYKKYRYYRSDTCLFIYLMHNAMSNLHNGYRKTYNLFGCNVLDVSVQSGKMEEEALVDHLHILFKKVYSDRFATDCHNGFFVPELRKTQSSFDAYLEYGNTVATIEELEYQNSYFIADMKKINKE